MRYAIVSDIHANEQAWKAALLDIRSLGADRLLCLGDLVGYGPAPAAVLESVYENVNHVILGNHDAAVCGRLDARHFHAGARRLVEWTRNNLNAQAMDFLRELPLSLHAEGFRCAHGDFAEPGLFHYIIDPEDALPSWDACPDPLMFVGHSHDPAIFVIGASGQPHRVPPQDFAMEEGKRYIVNVGSIGQPRDGDPRACYCLYDTTEQTVTWRRIPFDIDAYRAAMEAAGLDCSCSYFLADDPRLAARPLREMLSFSPPVDEAEAAEGTDADISVQVLARKASRWRAIATAVSLAAVLLLGTGGWLVHRYTTRGLVIDGTRGVPPLPIPAADEELLAPPAYRPDGTTIGGWRIFLGDRRRQTARVETLDGGERALTLASATGRDELRVMYKAISATDDMEFCLRATFLKDADFSGTVGTWVTVTTEKDHTRTRIDPYTGKQPNMRRKGGWMAARETFKLPAGTTSLEAGIRGKFTGTVSIKQISLERRR